MKIIIIAWLLLVLQEGVKGKPFLGSVVDTIHNIGCKVHDNGKCQPESNQTGQKQPQSLLGSLTQKIHATAHKINCAIKRHEGCVEPTTTETSSTQDISQLIDIRIKDGVASEVVWPSEGDETVTRRIISVPHNCPTGYRMDRRNVCREIQ